MIGQPNMSDDDPVKACFVDAVDDALRRTGINQALLAERVGITQKHMSQIMRGHAAGSLPLWARIFHELDLNLEIRPSSGEAAS